MLTTAANCHKIYSSFSYSKLLTSNSYFQFFKYSAWVLAQYDTQPQIEQDVYNVK